MVQNIQPQEYANSQRIQERYEELKKLVAEQEGRIQNLQNSAFQLANYYLVFQGVILAAISNSTSLTCSDAWFIFSLSLLAAVVNLLALLSIGTRCVRVMGLHDQTWAEFNFTGSLLPPIAGSSPQRGNYNGGDHEQWRDQFSQRRRYAVLGVCIFLFLAFTAVTLSGPWRVICKHDSRRRHPHGDRVDCLRLCDGSRCMFFCQDRS